MKKIFIPLLTFLFISNVNSQIIQQRLLKVDPADVSKFEAAVAKKTKMYNGKDGQARWVTFQIMTGKNAYHYVRMQIAQSMSEFDNIDTQGNSFWQKTVGPLHESEGNSIWKVNSEMTYNPKTQKRLNHRRVIFYNIKPSGLKDFWRFRDRSKKVWEEIGYENRVGVMNCISGCNSNWVQVRFHHKDFAGEDKDWSTRPEFNKKYNELFGEGSLDEDLERFRKSLMDDGRRVRHHKRMPELSSPWN